MSEGPIYFALVAFYGWHDYQDDWYSTETIAGVFEKPSQAIEAAKAVSTLVSPEKYIDVDDWDYMPYRILVDCIRVIKEDKDRIRVDEWIIVPVKLGEISLQYRDPETFLSRWHEE